MQKQFYQIFSLGLLVGLAVACSKKSDDPKAMPPISHNLAQCPSQIVNATDIQKISNGFILPGFTSQGARIDGGVHVFKNFENEEPFYQGGCMENSIRMNIYDSTKWMHLIITPSADGGVDITMNKMGQVETRHFGK